MPPLTPFIVEPILVERPWGGSRLADLGKAVPEGVRIGESWEVADLAPDAAPTMAVTSSSVGSGPLEGHTLRHLMDRHGADVMGDASPTAEGRFPLLIKLLDSREPLSIQVHPDAGYVDAHPEARLKTESWYISSADADAWLYLDVADGVTRDDLAGAFGTPAMLDLLDRIPARAGAFHHLPAGLIHALGAGCVVAEVQTPSDTTFRMYDWSEELDRAPRPLHRDEALASVRLHPPEAFSLAPSEDSRSLISGSPYAISEMRVGPSGAELTANGGPVVVMVVAGRVTIADLDLAAGATAIVPASAHDRLLTGVDGSLVLEVTVPV